MANKREFKKSVEALSSALVDEMMASYYNVEAADREKITSAITKVITAMQNAKNDSNKLFDKGVKDFENIEEYNKAKARFNKEKFEKAVDNFNNTIGDALKDYNEGMPKNVVNK